MINGLLLSMQTDEQKRGRPVVSGSGNVTSRPVVSVSGDVTSSPGNCDSAMIIG